MTTTPTNLIHHQENHMTTTTDNPDMLLWLDLETTGSDVDHDCIIEIGCVLTTTDLVEVASFDHVVQPTPLGLGRLMQNDVVRDMHTDNGLLAVLLGEDIGIDEPFAKIHHATESLLAWLTENGALQGRTVLAGSGVGHFDRKFIDRYMPQLSRHLRYWCIDIGVIRRAHDMWVGTPVSAANDSKTHRALDDVRCHLAEARAFRYHWAFAPTEVPS